MQNPPYLGNFQKNTSNIAKGEFSGRDAA